MLVTIPNSVTSIGPNAFSYCTGLTSVTIPDSVTSIGDGAFYNCTGLTTVTIPASVVSIGWGAFSYYNGSSIRSEPLPSLTLTVTAGSYAEAYCRENGLRYISIEPPRVTCGDNLTWSLDDDGLLTISGTGAMTDHPWAADRVRQVVMDGVTAICDRAFAGCVNLESITIPDSVKTIGSEAFSGCTALIQVTIPAGVVSLGDRAFAGCSQLTGVTFENCGTHRGTDAFADCPAEITLVHRWGEPTYTWSVDRTSVTADRACTRSGEHETETASATGEVTVEPTCTERGTTTYTSEAFANEAFTAQTLVEADVDTIPHAPVTDPAVAPTCTASGLTEGSHCAVCGQVLTAQQTVPATGHTAVADEGVPATDTAAGLTDGSHCAVCGEVLTAQQPIHPLTWEIEKTESRVTILRYWGTADSLTIPQALEDLPVRGIADGAFAAGHCSKNVYIPPEIDTIGRAAFANRVNVYCCEFSEADYWADDVGYPKIYTDDTVSGTFYGITMPHSFTMELGASRALGANVWPLTGRETVQITSSNPAAVAVEGETLTAVAVGQSRITLTVGGKTASVDVTVHADPTDFAIESDQGQRDELYIVTKEQCRLRICDVAPAGAEITAVWSSSSESVATVSPDGLIDARRPGEVTITVTAQNGLSRTYNIRVCYPVTQIRFEEAEYRVALGETLALSARAVTTGGTCTNRLVTFSTSDASVATVGNDGTVTAQHVGTAVITAMSASGVEESVTVTVFCPGHQAVSQPGTPATCEESGLTEGSTCALCGEVLVEQTEIPALGHDWGSASYIWSEDHTTVTATHTCRRDESHTETERVTAAATVTVPATCTEMGRTTYTASFRNAGFETQTQTLTDIPALGHAWSEPVYEWSADLASVTASRVCTRDHAHTETETVDAGSQITTPATCTVRGQTTYRSGTFANRAFEVQTRTLDNIPALGHSLVEIPAVAPTCYFPGSTAGSYCERCGLTIDRPGLIETTDHNLVLTVEVEPTPERDGRSVYYCTECSYRQPVITPRLTDEDQYVGRWSVHHIVDYSTGATVPSSQWGGMANVYYWFYANGSVELTDYSSPNSQYTTNRSWSIVNGRLTIQNAEAVFNGDGYLITANGPYTIFLSRSGQAYGDDFAEQALIGTWSPDHVFHTANDLRTGWAHWGNKLNLTVVFRSDHTMTVNGIQHTWAVNRRTLYVDGSATAFQINSDGLLVYSLSETTPFREGDYLLLTRDGQGAMPEEAVFTLQEGTRSIGEGAYEHINEQVVVINSGCTRIESRAFANCQHLIAVVIPSSVNSIAGDAFTGSNITIIAPAGSYAITWAEANGIANMIR